MSSGSEAHSVDPLVVDAVTSVRDRFGADGLQALVQLATEKLAEAERAAQELREYSAPVSTATEGPSNAADDQAWEAFVEQDPDTGDR